MQIDIPGTLRELERLVDRIAELIEWHKLTQQQRRLPFPTSFELNDHFAEETLDLQNCFAAADIQLRTLLADPHAITDEKQRQAWLRRLGQLEEWASALALAARFNNP